MGGRGSTVLPAYMEFHFAKAVRGMGEQLSLERAQGMGGGGDPKIIKLKANMRWYCSTRAKAKKPPPPRHHHYPL